MPYKDPVKLQEYKLRYKKEHPEQTRESNRKSTAKRKQKRLEWYRLNKYGLTPTKWQAHYDTQSGLCAICSLVEPTCVDHDHATGEVRGLLCRQCNSLLGMSKDKPETLAAAFAYLVRRPATIKIAVGFENG